MTLVDGGGQSEGHPELLVEPGPEGMQLRILRARGARLEETLLADGFAPDPSGDGSWIYTTVDAVGFLTRIQHLQTMRVEIAYRAGTCGANVAELLNRCLAVSRVTGTPWGWAVSRRLSRSRSSRARGRLPAEQPPSPKRAPG
jgi:hypothetical protein